MEKRSYKKYHDVYVELQEYCQNNIPRGLRQLPGERTLAAILGTSRMTLRKALEQALLNGLFIRRNKSLFIHPLRINACNLGKIVFVASGIHGELFLKALDRLYTKIYESLKQIGADIQLCLTNDDQTFEDLKRQCRDADIILLTTHRTGNHSTGEQVVFWQEMARNHKIIALSDPYLEFLPNYIALDNYAAGKIAAEALFAAGCKRPALLRESRGNVIFQKRTDGFMDFFNALELPVMKSDFYNGKLHHADFKRQTINHFVQSGCDGIFVVTDEHLDFAAHDLLTSGAVPEKVNLITVNASGAAFNAVLPIACVSHGTDKVAQAVIKLLKRLASEPESPNCKMLIQPHLYINSTLHLSEKQKEKLTE